MDFSFRDVNEESPAHHNILRCPFLRNINQPTNFSFPSLRLAVPIRLGKGPIFEDGSNFDMAFSLFHGSDGVVPLSDSSFPSSENEERQPDLPEFNPLAAKAATISLSSLGVGGPFSFGSFSRKWKNDKRNKRPFKRHSSSQGGQSKHEAASNEWLHNGNCPIAKSYRAVSGVLPLVAKVLKPPPGLKLRCPAAVVAARAAISRTAFARNLRPQSLPTKVLVIGMLGMALNVPLGIWREHTTKFSVSWFTAVHAAVPFIAMLRKSVLMPKSAMAFTIAASILGQMIGSRAERYRMKAIAAKKLSLVETSASSSSQLRVIGVKSGHWGELLEYSVLHQQMYSACCHLACIDQ